MKIISKEDYYYLVSNGCNCEGNYIDGLGIAGSDTVQVRSSHPCYPNEKAYAILQDTTFIEPVKLPTITPIVSPSTLESIHEEIKKMLDQIIQPAFTSEAKELANMLRKECQKQIEKRKEKIGRLTAKKSQTTDLKKINRINTNIQKWLDEIKEYEQVEYEINVLATSNQTYHVEIGSIAGNNSDVKYGGTSEYDVKTGVFLIRLVKKSIMPFAHELKHAYQFETGKLSSPSHKLMDKNTGRIKEYTFGMYNKEDEWEAFIRGKLFGGPRYDDEVYDFLLDQKTIEQYTSVKEMTTIQIYDKAGYPVNYHVMSADYIVDCERQLKDPLTPVEEKERIDKKLRRYAEVYNISFRCNGVTYRPENNRK